jgi:hypothetical protein
VNSLGWRQEFFGNTLHVIYTQFIIFLRFTLFGQTLGLTLSLEPVLPRFHCNPVPAPFRPILRTLSLPFSMVLSVLCPQRDTLTS